MFARLAIHIREPKITVGRISKGHRSEPIVRAGNEFAFLLACRAFSHPEQIAAQFLVMNEIAAAVVDECIAIELRGPGIAPIDSHAAGAREVSARTPAAFD